MKEGEDGRDVRPGRARFVAWVGYGHICRARWTLRRTLINIVHLNSQLLTVTTAAGLSPVLGTAATLYLLLPTCARSSLSRCCKLAFSSSSSACRLRRRESS